MSGLIDLEWAVPESQKAAQVMAIKLAGGTVASSDEAYVPGDGEQADYASAGFEPLMMIVGTAAGVYVIEAIAKLWRDRRAQGGVIVDARSGKLRVRPVPSMSSGTLVVVEEAGTRIFNKADEGSGKALLSDIVEKLVKR